MSVLRSWAAGTVLMCCASGAAAGQARPAAVKPQAAPQAVTYSVVYTGRFFGFFRHPSEQSEGLNTCSDVKEAPSGPARAFLDRMKTLSTDGLQLRVAVGDNFAPFILAREMKFHGSFVQKDLLVYDDASSTWIRNKDVDDQLMGRLVEGRVNLTFDNVACFMRLARLDAVVPGKHDFYYGGERLRALAKLLATARDAAFEPVQMLGANLSLVTTDTSRTPLPDRDIKHEGYVGKSTAGMHGATPILPKVTLPWLRRIRVDNAFRVNSVFDSGGKLAGYDLDELLDRATFPAGELEKLATLHEGTVEITDTDSHRYVVAPNVGAVLICPAGANPAAVSVPTAKGDPGKCRRLEPSDPEEPGRFHLRWPFHIPRNTGGAPDDDTRAEFALTPNTNQAVCLYESTDLSATPYCVPFSVHAPLLEDADSRLSASGDCASPGGRILPYVLKPGPNGECVAVFGVADPSLREYIGALNYTWLNKARDAGRIASYPELTTELEVSDPVEALTQLLQYCGADAACAHARKVLLAQMPRSKASEVAARFATGTFDLVIAMSDLDRASGHLTIDRTVVLNGVGVDAIAEPTVLVPGQHVTLLDPDVVRARLQRATVSIVPAGDASARTERRTIVNVPSAADAVTLPELPALPAGPGAQPVLSWIVNSAPAATLLPPGGATTRTAKRALLEQLALAVMQITCGADVALIQHRDVFWTYALEGQSVDSAGLRLALDAVFWKGDFVVCRSVTGATIKKLLARSGELAAAEANSVVGELEFGRAVAMAGLVKDGDDYVIDGQFLDDKKLYALATTDFLAVGDTGYDILRTEEPKPDPVGRMHSFNRLSALIHQAIAHPSVTSDDLDLSPDTYLDATNQWPFNTTTLHWYRVVGDWLKDFVGTNAAAVGAAPRDRRIEQRPIVSVAVETLDFKFSRYQHPGLSEHDVNAFFGGSSISTLVSPDSTSFGRDLQLRIKRSPSWGDYYSFGEIHSQRDETGRADNGPLVSEKRNEASLEGGVLLNLRPFVQRNPLAYKLLMALRVDTEADTPFQSVQLVNGQQRIAQFDRDYFATAKLGLRHEFKDSAFELGWLAGTKYHAARGFTFTGTLNNAEVTVTCPVTSTTSVSSCVKAKLDEYTSTQTDAFDHRQFGAFLNVRMHVPTGLGKLKLLSQETGQFFRDGNDDVSVDTKYRVNWKNSLEVPVIGNFSLAPSIEWFLFRNKGDEAHSFVSRSISIELKYSFEWHTGLGFRKALVFPSPGVAQ